MHVHGSQKRTLLELSPEFRSFLTRWKTQCSHGENVAYVYGVSVTLLAMQLHPGKIFFLPPFSRVLPRKDVEKPNFFHLDPIPNA